MLLSIANTTPRNVESVRTHDLLPQGIQASASTLVSLLEHYYKYINSEGLPSAEIGSISTLKDIDTVSMKYIDQIEELIGKSIPYSKVMNRVELYKIIVKYYNTRGSQDSIHTFFKIFFDQLVEIVYPRERLFDLSEGEGSWTSDVIIDESGESAFIRQLSDESTLTIDGITYASKFTDGRGQLFSVEHVEPDENSYEIAVLYDNGIITIVPGMKSRLTLDVDSISDGFNTYPVSDDMYFVGYGDDARPRYSEQIDNVTPLLGTPSRISWIYDRWIFTIGSPLGDVFAFYSLEDVNDPTLVTVWSPVWVGEETPITGNVNSISFNTNQINAQIFDALLNSEDIFNNLQVSADVYSAYWTSDIEVHAREYLSSNTLPIDVDPGRVAIVNGASVHPYVTGIARNFNGSIVWAYSGITDEWLYENHKSFASDEYKLFDGYYWQNYSYVIRSDVNSSVWLNDYMSLLHPAGLKLFTSVLIESFVRNEWSYKMTYLPTDDDDDSWLKALIPPHALNSSSNGFHSPKYQPGYLRDRVLRYIYQYLIDSNVDTELVRLVVMTFKYVVGAVDVRNSFVREQYVSEKFIDELQIGAGMLDETIEDADERYSNVNSCRFYNLSAIINSSNTFEYSFYDDDLGDGLGDWSGSSHDDDLGDGLGDWSGSSHEIL